MRWRGLRAGALACALTASLTLAACDDSTPPRASATTESGDLIKPGAATAAPAVDTTGHEVSKPGPRKDRLWRPDMLIFAKQSLSPDMVARIEKLKGVAHVESFSLGLVTIENHALTIASADPAAFRLFAPAATADAQDVWDRVAGGELAIKPGLGKKFQNSAGQMVLGNGANAPAIHIGAYAPLPTTIDMAVNETWAKTLNMAPGNALLISADQKDPSVFRKPIQRIVGKDASVQNLDIASRLGLDPDVKQTAYLTGGTIADVVGPFSYRVIGGGRIAPDPSWVAENITTEVMPIIGPMTCNKAIFPQLRAALNDVVAQGLASALHPSEYAGCYYPRFIAGTSTLSNHSFGLAMDFNVPGNQRGTVGEMNRTVVQIFKNWGFTWGGDWHYTDPMHFELRELAQPR
jgi:hypothetical protein